MVAIGIRIPGIGGYGVRITKIEDIVNKYSSTVVYDEINDSVRATVTIKNGEKYPIINGRTLTAGTYVFWYENETSLSKKLKLIEKYNLKGSGSWSLGQEPASTWNYFDKVINWTEPVIDVNVSSKNFFDVPTTHWAYDSIQLGVKKGWIKGRSENFFEPDGMLTRGEFAELISRICGYTYQNEGDFYLDIKNHWAKNSINAVSLQRIMNGYSNSLFMPDKAITREEVAKVLYYAIDLKDENRTSAEFKDVFEDRWSYEYIHKLGNLGILMGYEDGTFKPMNNIKRSEAVTLLNRIW